MRTLLILAVFTIFLGCSSSKIDPFKEGVRSAFNQLDQGGRRISSEEIFSASNLKSQEMLLFPKAFKFNLKISGERIDYKALDKMNDEEKKRYFAKKVEYLKPIEFKITPLVTDLCQKLATQEGSKFESFDFLTGRSFNPSEKCVVIEVKRKLPTAFGKKVLEVRRDDLLKMQIYLGENLKPYGKKVFLAVQAGRERYREVDILNSTLDTMSSELDLIPIDIPNPLNYAVRGNIKAAEDKVIRIPSDLFVIAAINKNTKFQPCKKGSQIDYQDVLGNPVKIDWCAGENWPRTINTPRFFAIKK
ncbi:MAG: hypothetical protein ACHQYQ_11685 [Bacteriovoracales bacterium]